MLLLSLLMSDAQNLLAHDVQDKGGIALTLDTNTHDNDASEQPALISRTTPSLYDIHSANYPTQPAWPARSNCFPPHDRPPAENV